MKPSEIMVVDDTAESLKLLSELLESEGYQVRPTTDPELALQSALDVPPALILLDVRMPGMDGFEVCTRLKADERTAEIPVIFVSAARETQDQLKGFDVGGVDYITKPIQREVVLARVETHLKLHLTSLELAALLEARNHELQLDNERFEALYKLSRMSDAGEIEATAFALEAAVAMTRSEVGYLHFVNADDKSIDLFQWSKKTLEQCTAEPMQHYPLESAGVWADCIRQGKTVIHNDYPSLEDKHGMPEGHFPIRRHMSVPIFDKGQPVAIIGIGNKKEPYNDDDARQLSLFGSGVWSIIRERRNDRRLLGALNQTIAAITSMLELRDPYTAGHQRRVSALASAIAMEMALDEDAAEGMRMGGLIHDIGKIHIPAEILVFPGKLDEEERVLIQRHPDMGYAVLKDHQFPWPIAEMIHQHHERLDGSGYPQGLKGDGICLEARILAVADVVEAMASHRPYRRNLGIEAALQEIEKGRGVIFDAAVVDACLELFRGKGYELETL